jgi:leader peptidase (prepilin peptidase) / N-methyltransferase
MVHAVAAPSARKLASLGWWEELAAGYSMAGPKTRLIVGLLAVAAVFVSVVSAPGSIGILGAALALLTLAIAIIDWRRFVIPNELSGAGLGLALVHAAVQEPNAMLVAVAFAVLRGVILAAVFLLIRYTYRRLRGRDGIGLGDIKLAGVAGAWLDWSMLPTVVEIAACAALLVYLVRQFAGGRPLRATSRLPFGLFFAPATWICWLLETTLLAPF